jgi:hypothetical protein
MSYISNFEYQKNDDNELVAAIYPIRHIMDQNDEYHEHLGGGKNNLEMTGTSRFDGLGVPIGLYLSKTQIKEIQNLKKNPEISKECNVIDEDKFNKLLDRIVKKTQKKLSIKNHKKPGFKKGDSKTKRRWLGGTLGSQ